MPHATGDSKPSIGSRVQIGNCKATVKYFGEVKDQTGNWIGLEWDDAARGKNDGSTSRSRYFSCRQAGAGSFMRREKFASQAILGRDILSSLQDRYGDQSSHNVQMEDTQRPSTQTEKRKGVEWQLVGADKVQAKLSELNTLQKASLIGSQVAAVVRKLLAHVLQQQKSLATTFAKFRSVSERCYCSAGLNF